jgi:hypothetical protein
MVVDLKANQISYESAAEEVIDFVGVRGDMVMIMGEGILRPNKDAPYAGKTVHRRRPSRRSRGRDAISRVGPEKIVPRSLLLQTYG